jgi:6-pyruvoyltetrahydropterin/6-carboxytetrahydropterin synthase
MSGVYRITVERVFCASHQLKLPDGQLEPLHGHNWTVWVTVEARKLDGIETVMDFHLLQERLEQVLKPLENRHLNDLAVFRGVNPSAERVAERIAREIRLIPGVNLVEVSVSEADRCRASFVPDRGLGRVRKRRPKL